MWFRSTELVSAEEAVICAGQQPESNDWEALVECESAVRDFALGVRSLDLHRYVNATATFVDIHAVVHQATGSLSPRDVLGIDASQFKIESVDFSSSGSISTSVTQLECKTSLVGRPNGRIAWTKTWQLAAHGWRILNSHACWDQLPSAR